MGLFRNRKWNCFCNYVYEFLIWLNFLLDRNYIKLILLIFLRGYDIYVRINLGLYKIINVNIKEDVN